MPDAEPYLYPARLRRIGLALAPDLIGLEAEYCYPGEGEGDDGNSEYQRDCDKHIDFESKLT